MEEAEEGESNFVVSRIGREREKGGGNWIYRKERNGMKVEQARKKVFKIERNAEERELNQLNATYRALSTKMNPHRWLSPGREAQLISGCLSSPVSNLILSGPPPFVWKLILSASV